MTQAPDALQTPAPGSRRLCFCGDTIEFTLRLPNAPAGQAWLRELSSNHLAQQMRGLEQELPKRPFAQLGGCLTRGRIARIAWG